MLMVRSRRSTVRSAVTSPGVLASALPLAVAALAGTAAAAEEFPPCEYGKAAQYSAEATGVFVKQCSGTDPTQSWGGATLAAPGGPPSPITNRGAPEGTCLSVATKDPISMAAAGCGGTSFVYSRANKTISVAGGSASSSGSKVVSACLGEGGRCCLDLNHGTGPDVDFWACHPAGSASAGHQQFEFDAATGQLRAATNASLCLALNKTLMMPYIWPPCTWPSEAPAGQPPPFERSTRLRGITVLENATAIPHYGADTFYPAEDRAGDLFSGYDDGTVGNISVGSMGPGFHTGSAIVSGRDWRTLSVTAVGGARYEDGLPDGGTETVQPGPYGRYTCANTVVNGTWWVGTYGLARGDGSCEAGTGVLQFCDMYPFVGFRYSTSRGATWAEPHNGTTGKNLTVSNSLFGEVVGASIKFGAPHVVDHGPENTASPTGHMYMVGNGCLASKPNSNCSWISGDAVFLTRAAGFSAADPNSLNDRTNWEFYCGPADASGAVVGQSGAPCWTADVDKAVPIFTWRGRVGTVTATWHPTLKLYLFAVTTPTTLPSTVGPYDTYVLEAPSLTGPFKLVTCKYHVVRTPQHLAVLPS
jgi:hypothetical protein